MPKLVIDKLNDATGWTSNASIPVTENEYPQFIANENEKSLLVKFDNNKDDFVEKTLSTDLTGFKEVRFWIISFYRAKERFAAIPDFSYKVDLGFKEFYVTARKQLTPVDIQIPTGVTITKFKITALHNERDVIIFSHLIAINEQLPLDILDGLIEFMQPNIPALTEVGLATGTAGENTVSISGLKYINRYSVISFNGEKHNVESVKPGSPAIVTLGELFNGKSLTTTPVDSAVTLEFVVSKERRARNYIGNSITLIAGDPELLPQDNEESFLIDTFDVSGTVAVRNIGATKILPVQIDVESEHKFILFRISEQVEKFIERRTFWANSVKLEMVQIGSSRIFAPQQDIVPKKSYIITIEHTEETCQRISQLFPLPNVLNLTVEPT